MAASHPTRSPWHFHSQASLTQALQEFSAKLRKPKPLKPPSPLGFRA